jgi:hypothetical protein
MQLGSPIIPLTLVFESLGFKGVTGMDWGILSGAVSVLAIELGYRVEKIHNNTPYFFMPNTPFLRRFRCLSRFLSLLKSPHFGENATISFSALVCPENGLKWS